ncbi:MAG: hypothetical protein HY958_04940 [Bacteroidia bacterium]|nr:hypothetical protein [Bacteroidia bacterium]
MVKHFFKKIFLLSFIVLYLQSIVSFAGVPDVTVEKKSNTENMFERGFLTSFSPDITFYPGQIINGFGINMEPSINEYLSLNYRFALNYDKGENFSIHGNPGTVVSPFMFSLALSADSNRAGWVFLGFLTLLLPEGVNFKYIPSSYSKMAFSAYLNPFGVDYARRLEGLPKTLYMSGEAGIKACFSIGGDFYFGAYGGIRTIYRFQKLGFTAGINIGLKIQRKEETNKTYTY